MDSVQSVTSFYDSAAGARILANGNVHIGRAARLICANWLWSVKLAQIGIILDIIRFRAGTRIMTEAYVCSTLTGWRGELELIRNMATNVSEHHFVRASGQQEALNLSASSLALIIGRPGPSKRVHWSRIRNQLWVHLSCNSTSHSHD